MPNQRHTDAELDAMDDADALRRAYQKRLLAISVKLDATGLDLDELIELIEARQNGRY